MASGLFVSDCSSTDWGWLDLADPGCLIQKAGGVVGQTVTTALEPVWIILGFILIVLLIIAFAPNVKHIVPHLSFL